MRWQWVVAYLYQRLKISTMKFYRLLFIAIALLVGSASFAQEQTDTIKVYGNCGMCKSRIEKA